MLIGDYELCICVQYGICIQDYNLAFTSLYS